MTLALPDGLLAHDPRSTIERTPAWAEVASAAAAADSVRFTLGDCAQALCVDLWPVLDGGRLIVRGPGGLAAPWAQAVLDEPAGLLLHDGEGVPVTLELLPWTVGTRIERRFEQRYLRHPDRVEIIRNRGTMMQVRPAAAV